ncbi:hypothetical protein BT63DRAFT_427986 [Microthyrium microscopicum]|uniref:Uncharacterized protein n=1 Tax=Microthyrium microscopicum TaxID=703497 RepID=A0A6A6U3F2_9PEZI|nr:hypothetical protein BT63DRAFT_427986 [Microthyrium microscopicum]
MPTFSIGLRSILSRCQQYPYPPTHRPGTQHPAPTIPLSPKPNDCLYAPQYPAADQFQPHHTIRP